jgi:hypothetical protein
MGISVYIGLAGCQGGHCLSSGPKLGNGVDIRIVPTPSSTATLVIERTRGWRGLQSST